MNNCKRSQQGVALITGLLMLLIMSLVGVATMENSMVQTSLASNTQLKAMSYQEAEAALKRASSLQWMIAAMSDADERKVSYTERESYNETTDVTANIEISYCGTLPSQNVYGLSLDANQAANSNGYTHYVFDITSDVELTAAGNAKSRHMQRSSRLMMAASDAGAPCILTEGI